jgi:four helix bundle protein
MAQAPAKRFQDLIVWEKSHQMVLVVYKLTKTLPKEELFGLVSQMRRAAVSVPANIAEGFKKRGRSDKARHMNIAQGSLEELRYYFILCEDLSYLSPSALAAQIEEVARLLGAYTRSASSFLLPDLTPDS